MLKTDSDLFDMHLKNHTSAIDSVGQKHVVYVDQVRLLRDVACCIMSACYIRSWC